MQEGDAKNLEFMGTEVIVRTYGGAPRIARVISVTEYAAFACAPEYFDEIAAGDRAPPMVGFPLSDVFEMDRAIFAEIAKSRDWQLATPFAVKS
jgi:hypothetical protein